MVKIDSYFYTIYHTYCQVSALVSFHYDDSTPGNNCPVTGKDIESACELMLADKVNTAESPTAEIFTHAAPHYGTLFADDTSVVLHHHSFLENTPAGRYDETAV